jgi:hypothetical protein
MLMESFTFILELKTMKDLVLNFKSNLFPTTPKMESEMWQAPNKLADGGGLDLVKRIFH